MTLGQLPENLGRRGWYSRPDDQESDDDLIRTRPLPAIIGGTLGNEGTQLAIGHPRLDQTIGIDESFDPTR